MAIFDYKTRDFLRFLAQICPPTEVTATFFFSLWKRIREPHAKQCSDSALMISSGGRGCLGEGRLELPGQVWELKFLPSFLVARYSAILRYYSCYTPL